MKNSKAAAANNGSVNPMIIFDSNQGLRMSNYAQISNKLQSRLPPDLTINSLINLGYWRDSDGYLEIVVAKQNCSKCRTSLTCEIYSNIEYVLVFAVCKNCSNEYFRVNLSHKAPTSNYSNSLNFEEAIQ
jgi:hypothetical protein